jgi:hypothetical protein
MDLKYQRPSLCPADSRCDREHRAREVLERRLEPSKALPPQQHGSALAPLAPKRLFNGCNPSSLCSGNLEPAAKPPVIQQHSLRCCGKRHEHALKATPRVLRSRSLICIQGESKLAILGTLADTEFESLQLIKGRPTRLAVHECKNVLRPKRVVLAAWAAHRLLCPQRSCQPPVDAARLQERRRSCGPARHIARNRRFEPCPEHVLAQVAGARDSQPMTLCKLTHANGRRFHAQPACLCEHDPVSHLAKNAVTLQRVVHELMPSIVSHHRRLLDAPCLRCLAWE